MKWVNRDSTTWNLIGRNLLHVQNCEIQFSEYAKKLLN